MPEERLIRKNLGKERKYLIMKHKYHKVKDMKEGK